MTVVRTEVNILMIKEKADCLLFVDQGNSILQNKNYTTYPLPSGADKFLCNRN